jgi:two-component system, NarL family, nitrate/nitrite response regulator NarL
MNVLIAHHQRLLRDGVRPFLIKLGAKVEIFDADSLEHAIFVADPGGCDLALLGHTMPGMNGVAGIRVFAEKFPSTKVVLLTATADSATVLGAVDAGAHGVISKTMSGRGMQHALRLVLAGECYLPPNAIMALARSNDLSLLRGQLPAFTCQGIHFSPAETEVIPLLLDGLPNKLITQHLGIDEAAIKARLRGVYKKIGATNRAQAVWGLLSLGQARSG